MRDGEREIVGRWLHFCQGDDEKEAAEDQPKNKRSFKRQKIRPTNSAPKKWNVGHVHLYLDV